jgi:hypothetical protein
MNLQQAQLSFIGQYLYQKMWVSRYTPREFSVLEMIPEIIDDISDYDGSHLNCYPILLRLVNQLTDKDLRNIIDLYNLYFSGEKEPIDTAHIDFEKGEIEYYYPNNSGCCTIQFDELPQPCTDYLKAKGYLLPFTYIDDTGKPVTLSAEEIIANGWAKLTPIS